jgi:MoxR-like ATPase
MTSTTTTTQLDVKRIGEAVEAASEPFRRLAHQMHRVVVGHDDLLHGMLIGLLANGHLLIEGVPGLAKTTAVSCLAGGIHTAFQRIQFTPDLLPADLIGTLVYQPQDGQFVVQKGPIFSNIILADEINRAPAKVQSALLEAPSARRPSVSTSRSSCSPRRTPSSRRGRTRCPRRRSTASCSSSSSAIRIATRSARSSTGCRGRAPGSTSSR